MTDICDVRPCRLDAPRRGLLVSKVLNALATTQNTRMVMLGLDAAGKTTILYKLKLGDLVTTIPTIGFNVEQVTYKNLSMHIWDVGGQDKIRPRALSGPIELDRAVVVALLPARVCTLGASRLTGTPVPT